MILTTYAAWFEAQANRGDDIGVAAAAWRDAKGDRPRASAVETVRRWLLADPDRVPMLPGERLSVALDAAAREYSTGNHQASTVPIPGQPVASVHQLPGQGAEPDLQERAPIDQQPGWAADAEGVFTALQHIVQGIAHVARQNEAIMAALAAQERAFAPLNAAVAALDEAERAEDAMASRGVADGLIGQQMANGQAAWQDSQQPAGGYQQASQPAAETDWAAIHPVHCRDDRCNGGATCGCPCHQLAAGQQVADQMLGQAVSQLGQVPVPGQAFYRGAVPEPAWDVLAQAAQLPEDGLDER